MQTIHDSGNKLDIETTYIKVPGGEHGGNWGVRIKGTPRAEDGGHDDLKSTVMFYVGLEGLGSLEADTGEEGEVKEPQIKGSTAELGDFDIKITKGQGNKVPTSSHAAANEKSLDKDLVKSLTVPLDAIWQSKGLSHISMA